MGVESRRRRQRNRRRRHSCPGLRRFEMFAFTRLVLLSQVDNERAEGEAGSCDAGRQDSVPV